MGELLRFAWVVVMRSLPFLLLLLICHLHHQLLSVGMSPSYDKFLPSSLFCIFCHLFQFGKRIYLIFTICNILFKSIGWNALHLLYVLNKNHIFSLARIVSILKIILILRANIWSFVSSMYFFDAPPLRTSFLRSQKYSLH